MKDWEGEHLREDKRGTALLPPLQKAVPPGRDLE
jgi:hypothetical protein